MFSSQDPEAGFEGSYGGKQKQANGVISMLEAWKLWLHWELLHQWHLNQSKSCFIFPVFETAQSLPTFGRWSVMTLRSLRQALKSLKIRQQMSSPNSNCNQRQTSVARQLRRSWTRRSKMVEGREDLVFFFCFFDFWKKYPPKNLDTRCHLSNPTTSHEPWVGCQLARKNWRVLWMIWHLIKFSFKLPWIYWMALFAPSKTWNHNV